MPKGDKISRELIRVYGRLERAYGSLIDEPGFNGSFDLEGLKETLMHIDRYKHLILFTPYMKKDMMDDRRLTLLEEKCNQFIEENPKRIDNSQKA